MNFVVVGFGFMGMTHIEYLENPNLHLKAIVDKAPENILQNSPNRLAIFHRKHRCRTA